MGGPAPRSASRTRSRISTRSKRWNESPSMTCALRPSRRKIWAKLFMTVVVPAPDDPVTAMMGCLTDMSRLPSEPRFGAEHRALVEERRVVGTIRSAGVLGVIALDAIDFVARTQDQRHALMQRLGYDVEQGVASGRGAAAGLFDQQGDRVGLVQ